MRINQYDLAVKLLEQFLSQDEMETLNDAIHCYGRHPEDHTYPEEMDILVGFAKALDGNGHNSLYDEYDILKRPSASSENA